MKKLSLPLIVALSLAFAAPKKADAGALSLSFGVIGYMFSSGVGGTGALDAFFFGGLGGLGLGGFLTTLGPVGWGVLGGVLVVLDENQATMQISDDLKGLDPYVYEEVWKITSSKIKNKDYRVHEKNGRLLYETLFNDQEIAHLRELIDITPENQQTVEALMNYLRNPIQL